MSDPIVMVSNLIIKEGKVEEYKQFTQEATEWIKANRPRTDAILEYSSADGTELSIVIVFPDADAMQTHMEGLGEFPNKTREFAQVDNIQIYGQPNKTTLETMKMIADSGVTFNIKPQAIGGYIRLKSG